MDVQEINVYIDKDGQVHVEVRGVKGTNCLEITQPLEEALGGEVILREMTPEALEPPSGQISQEERLKNQRRNG